MSSLIMELKHIASMAGFVLTKRYGPEWATGLHVNETQKSFVYTTNLFHKYEVCTMSNMYSISGECAS